MEAVRPSTNLEELVIDSYMGAFVSPSWMVSLSNLTRLAFLCSLGGEVSASFRGYAVSRRSNC
ncbi:hypothetical protein LINGRAHAP2_LOCUS19227 [Linum grandiflorum]